MTFRHVALYRWADHVDTDHVRRVAEALDRLATRLPGVITFEHGGDVGMSLDGFGYHLIVEFRTIDDWRTYRDHPDRLLLAAELLDGAVAEQAEGQFTIGAIAPDLDPGLSDDEIMTAARRLAAERMAALLAEPDDLD